MTTPAKKLAVLIASVISLLGVHSSVADDTEVYLNQVQLPAEQIRPNVVIILDTSGSMGLPASAAHGTSKGKEKDHYDSNVTYPVAGDSTNITGGLGDTDYIYLYEKPNTFADQYIYWTRVHTSQIAGCDMSSLYDSTPYTSGDKYIFSEGVDPWAGLCDEKPGTCGFNAGPLGPGNGIVDCQSVNASGSSNGTYSTPTLYAFSANFHNWLQSYYRYSVMQSTMRDLIEKDYDVNMAIARFNGGSGGYIIKESVLATDPVEQTSMKLAVTLTEANGSTPLTEALWEAALYLRGENALYGNGSYNGRKSVDDSFSSGTTYDSPINFECQKSHIILLTDGTPTSDTGRDSAVSGLITGSCSSSSNATEPSQSCLDDYANWLYTDANNNSLRRDHSGSLDGDQSITIHTIGFGLNNNLLKAAAVPEDGINVEAKDAGDLAAAFSTILDQLEFEKDTFVAPAVAVNAYSGLQHREELYFALFQPSASPRWTGNIKKYKLIDGQIVDANLNPAINENTGYFRSGEVDAGNPGDYIALSFWTELTDWLDDGIDADLADGADIQYGGFAYELDDTTTTRKIYTYWGSTSPSNFNLALPGNVLSTTNTNITEAMFGPGVTGAVSPVAERFAVIEYARGVDGAAPTYFIGDFIHNQPVVVTYNTSVTLDAMGEVDTITFDDTLYAANNMGFFFAIDPDDSEGTELFSFVPKELLPNLTTYYQDSGTFSDKVYGLDAPLSVWRFDEDKNGSIDGANDHVYLYQAMRRGGTSIYALDVTTRTSPKLMWQIDGRALDGTADGYDSDPSASPSGDFKDLAQTWSVPKLSKIRINCSIAGDPTSCDEKDVLFFGGGHDPVHDDATTPVSSSAGNAIFMVDATTGDLLWSAGNGGSHDLNSTAMINSFAATVTVGDVDSDGFADALFAVDIQGDLWRFDFAKTPSGASDFAQGGLIADLGGTGSDFRRFYNIPDVAYFAQRGNDPFLTISVASGYRAHPRDTGIDDRLFVIFDYNPLSPPPEDVGSPGDYDYTYDGTNVITSTAIAANDKLGWYLDLSGDDEKGLARTITFGGQIIMSTFLPGDTSGCEGSTGEGRLYLLDALDGASVLETSDIDDTIVPFKALQHGGIPPEPAVIYSTEQICVANCSTPGSEVYEERTNTIVCVGTECVDHVVDVTMEKTYWRENRAY